MLKPPNSWDPRITQISVKGGGETDARLQWWIVTGSRLVGCAFTSVSTKREALRHGAQALRRYSPFPPPKPGDPHIALCTKPKCGLLVPHFTVQPADILLQGGMEQSLRVGAQHLGVAQ